MLRERKKNTYLVCMLTAILHNSPLPVSRGKSIDMDTTPTWDMDMGLSSHLVSAYGALDAGVLKVLRRLDDGEELRELVPLPSLPGVVVQAHLILQRERATTRDRPTNHSST